MTIEVEQVEHVQQAGVSLLKSNVGAGDTDEGEY